MPAWLLVCISAVGSKIYEGWLTTISELCSFEVVTREEDKGIDISHGSWETDYE